MVNLLCSSLALSTSVSLHIQIVLFIGVAGSLSLCHISGLLKFPYVYLNKSFPADSTLVLLPLNLYHHHLFLALFSFGPFVRLLVCGSSDLGFKART